jgi:hypothetical protein
MFVADDSGGIFVEGMGRETMPPAGEEIAIEGHTGPGEFAPVVIATALRSLGRKGLPPARAARLEQLTAGREDSQWIEIAGVVRHAAADQSGHLVFDLVSGPTHFRAYVPRYRGGPPPTLIDARIRVQAVAGTQFNQKRQLTGLTLFVPGMEEIAIEDAAPAEPFAVRATPIDTLLRFESPDTFGRRVRVHGVVTRSSAQDFFIQDDTGGLQVYALRAKTLQPGQIVDVLGFPAAGSLTPVLEEATFRLAGDAVPSRPAAIDYDEAFAGDYDSQLVRIEAQLLDVVPSAPRSGAAAAGRLTRVPCARRRVGTDLCPAARKPRAGLRHLPSPRRRVAEPARAEGIHAAPPEPCRRRRGESRLVVDAAARALGCRGHVVRDSCGLRDVETTRVARSR